MFCYTDTNANAVPIYGVGVGFVVAKLHASMNRHYSFKIGTSHDISVGQPMKDFVQWLGD